MRGPWSVTVPWSSEELIEKLIAAANVCAEIDLAERDDSRKIRDRPHSLAVAMVALSFPNWIGSQQFAEMEAGCLRRDVADEGQFSGRKGAAADQRNQDRRTRRFRHQPCDRKGPSSAVIGPARRE